MNFTENELIKNNRIYEYMSASNPKLPEIQYYHSYELHSRRNKNNTI